MATICPVCGSADTQVGLADQNQCLNCSRLFDSQGNTLDVGPDETTRAVMAARMAPRTQHPVGNLADLQRLGAKEAVNPDAPEFVLPPGVDPERVPEHGVDAGAVIPGGLVPTVPEPAPEPVDTAKADAIAEGRAAGDAHAAAERVAAKDAGA